MKHNLHLQTHHTSCSTTRLQLFCQPSFSNWSFYGDAFCFKGSDSCNCTIIYSSKECICLKWKIESYKKMCSTNCIFIILFIIHNVFLPSKKFSIPKGLYRYKNSHFEGFGVFECSIIKLLLNTAITLWPLFLKIVRNFVVPTQPATWAIQLNLCLKPQPLDLFGPVQTTGYL